jgi:hypothetical protein
MWFIMAFWARVLVAPSSLKAACFHAVGLWAITVVAVAKFKADVAGVRVTVTVWHMPCVKDLL